MVGFMKSPRTAHRALCSVICSAGLLLYLQFMIRAMRRAVCGIVVRSTLYGFQDTDLVEFGVLRFYPLIGVLISTGLLE